MGPTILSQIREDRTLAHMLVDWGPRREVEALPVRPSRRDREAAGSLRKTRLLHTPNPSDRGHLHLGRCNAFPKSLPIKIISLAERSSSGVSYNRPLRQCFT
jgi:hypothetical protein